MSTPCTVIIGATELLDALRESAAADGEVLSFSDKEPLKALEAITTRRPNVIALERLFAATSRGAALINRIKADPALAASKFASYRSTAPIASLRAARRRVRHSQPLPLQHAADAQIDVVEPTPAVPAAQSLDYRGTRRAPRFRMAEGTEVQVDGALATIVDLRLWRADSLPDTAEAAAVVRMVLADDLGW